MGFEKNGAFFIPKFYNLLLQINGRKCKRKGGSGGRRGDEEVWETQKQRSKEEPVVKEREEMKCFLGTHGFSIFKNYQFISYNLESLKLTGLL